MEVEMESSESEATLEQMNLERAALSMPLLTRDEIAPRVGTADSRCSFPATPAMSPIGGSQAWGSQVWPYGKTTPVYGVAGGQRNAWGDLTRPPGS